MGDRTLPYFAANAAAAVVIVAAFAAWVYSEYRIGRNRPALGAKNRDGGSGRWVGIGLLASYVGGALISALVPRTVITGHGGTVFIAGLLIAVVGQGLRLAAVRQLGESFTFKIHTAPGQIVVDSGLYRFVRHPSYTGALICALGFTIAYTNWLAPLTVLVLAFGYVKRIPAEEQALAADLGEPYRRYMSHTKRLIPFVL
ncbi:methyltransferase family protein [Nocardia sp. NBC_01388]|uniref:methyltransferase family protein n=1 Tax=Nocardia sp. NBC_01388 TaxID=2903596 RepID=UPI00324CBDC1